MPFNCMTTAAQINPQTHYTNSVAVVQMSEQMFTAAPVMLNSAYDTFDQWLFILSQVSADCTAAWNEIVAAGAAGNYQPPFLDALHAACEDRLQPTSEFLTGVMSNSQDAHDGFQGICGVVIRFADPLNTGSAPIPNPFP